MHRNLVFAFFMRTATFFIDFYTGISTSNNLKVRLIETIIMMGKERSVKIAICVDTKKSCLSLYWKWAVRTFKSFSWLSILELVFSVFLCVKGSLLSFGLLAFIQGFYWLYFCLGCLRFLLDTQSLFCCGWNHVDAKWRHLHSTKNTPRFWLQPIPFVLHPMGVGLVSIKQRVQ